VGSNGTVHCASAILTVSASEYASANVQFFFNEKLKIFALACSLAGTVKIALAQCTVPFEPTHIYSSSTKKKTHTLSGRLRIDRTVRRAREREKLVHLKFREDFEPYVVTFGT
jgi:hypothetical protein